MILVQLTGGLGNQMFQYAFARALQDKTNFEIKLDITELENPDRPYALHHFRINQTMVLPLEASRNAISKTGGRIAIRRLAQVLVDQVGILDGLKNRVKARLNLRPELCIAPNMFHLIPALLNPRRIVIRNGMILRGYWQNEAYFVGIERQLRKEFSFREPLGKQNLELAEFLEHRDNAISVHVRRGDYVHNPRAAKLHGGICDRSYYEEAAKILTKRVRSPVFYVFSDEPKWVADNLSLPGKTVLVDWNQGDNSFRDMQLMSLCSHNIIANSTFSWWGAWLNKNPRKTVVAPREWFRGRSDIGIVPSSWVRV